MQQPSNPFETASALVGDLQEQYDKYAKALPKLKENHKAATEELAAINKKVVDAQAKLDGLLEQIKTNTESYNAWQAGMEAELKGKYEAFATEKADHEAKVLDYTSGLDAERKQLEIGQQQLATYQTKLVAGQKELDEQVKANNKWADNLVRQEAEQTGTREELINMGNAAGERVQELDQREAKLKEDEEQTAKLLQAAERDRKSAKLMLNGAKESIADNDAREDSLNMREKTLGAKEADLRKKEVALNDRASVLASH